MAYQEPDPDSQGYLYDMALDTFDRHYDEAADLVELVETYGDDADRALDGAVVLHDMAAALEQAKTALYVTIADTIRYE